MIGFYSAGAMGNAGGGFSPIYSDGIVFPYTYDDDEFNGLVTWTRAGGLLASPSGAIFDGVTSRVSATSGLPSWLTTGPTGPLTIQATVELGESVPTGFGSSIVSVGPVPAPTSSYFPKLELHSARDIYNGQVRSISARARQGSSTAEFPIARRGWNFDFRFPEANLYPIRPQGIHFLDENTLLLTGYQENFSNLSSCYKVSYPSGEVLGKFDFPSAMVGSTHINAIARSSAGHVWFCGNGSMYRVDLDASFSSGTCVVEATFAITDYTSFMAIATIDGVEYGIGGQYLTSGTPMLVVFPYSLMENGGTFNISDRTNQFIINQRTQGAVWRDGKIYFSMNRTTAESSGSGWIHECDLDLSAPDGSSLVVPVRAWPAPSQYPEDVDFHPVTGRLVTPTEGYSSVGSSIGWLSVWSSPLDGSAQPQTPTLEYDGAGILTIKLNGRPFETRSVTPSLTPNAVYIGSALTTPTQGNSENYFDGRLSGIVIQQGPMSDDAYRTVVEGYYTPQALIPSEAPLVNPGAESGTTGWTAEVGSLGNRSANPPPHSGAAYFFGGPNASTRARQRIDLLADVGLTAAEIDAGDILGRVLWWAAGFSATEQDTSTLGLRFLDGSQDQISLSYGDKIRFYNQRWTQRQHAHLLPIGTRYVDVMMDATRVGSGTNLDSFFDDIELVFYRRS